MDQQRAAAGAQILLVDDEPDQLEMYQYGLEAAGFVVMPATTGAQALEIARSRHPDVIVLDVRLPDVTGWEVCAAIKADPATAQIPVIMLTAAVSPTLPREAASAGCAAYLVKPCYPDQLSASIRSVLAAT